MSNGRAPSGSPRPDFLPEAAGAPASSGALPHDSALIDPGLLEQDPAGDISSQTDTRLDRAIRRMGTPISVIYGVAALIALYEIVARYAFNAPTSWVHETTIALGAFGYLVGGPLNLAADRHIRIGLIYHGTSGRRRQFLDVVNAALTLTFALALAYAAFTMVDRAWFSPGGGMRLERSGSAWNPVIPAIIKMVLLLVALLLALQSVGHLLGALRRKVPATGATAGRGALLAIFAVLVILGAIAAAVLLQGRALGIETGSYLLVAAIMIMILTGIPLAFVTGLVAIVFTLGWFGTNGLPLVGSRMYSLINEYTLVAVPMFVLMASLLDRSGMARDLYDAMKMFSGRIRGGVAVQTMVAAVFLAAISGIIGGEIVLLGLIALPQMLRLGYNRAIAIGTVVAGGSLGTMIPPSIVLIIYGLTASVSIGDLFLATVMPGLMMAAMYITYILVMCRMHPEYAPLPADTGEVLGTAEKLKLLKGVLLPALVGVMVLGSIYSGVASITEAAVVGVFGVLMAAGIRRELSVRLVLDSLRQTLMTSGMIIWIALGAAALVGIYNLMGGNRFIEAAILGSGASPIVVVLIMMAILIVLGLFMDWIGIALLTMPIFVPIIVQLGYSPVWFGILFAMNMQISYISPPFGPAVFYLKSVAPPDITLGEIFRAMVPFIFLQMIAIGLVLAFPAIALWLPGL